MSCRTPVLHPLAAAVALAYFCATPGHAQQAPAPEAAASAPSGTTSGAKLETVTVTAERRSESILDVPVSVSTLSGEKLDV
ncbi:MAG TPA: hypothetical protein VFV25_12535, partial [Methylibium sp.]